MSTLVIAEHDNSNLKPSTLNTLAAANAIGGGGGGGRGDGGTRHRGGDGAKGAQGPWLARPEYKLSF